MTADTQALSTALKAGLAYFTAVFALGFALGAIRLMLLVPLLGELVAVILEVAVILVACWLLCSRAISLMKVPASIGPRALMGGSAFILLMTAEYLLATLMFSETAAAYLAELSTPAGAVGLLGQILYGLFPLLQLRFYGDQV